MQGWI